MKTLIIGVGLVLLAMYGIYFYNVYDTFTKADLGPLGDFIGGNVNPILTFISTVLLIETVVIQRSAAADAKASEITARETIKQQSDLAAKQSFESSLFNIINLCLSEYKNTVINLKSGSYSGSLAFGKYLDIYDRFAESGTNKEKILERLEEASSDALFDNIKNFAVAFKFINEYAPEHDRENYISITLTMIPTSFIHLMCIARLHSSWPILSNIEKSGIFEREAMQQISKYYA
uniref:DUF4760 domain-containing protein n=1 Tax=Pseudomonas graminis TaxID=158627 RepID=A0A7C2AY23_9PSED